MSIRLFGLMLATAGLVTVAACDDDVTPPAPMPDLSMSVAADLSVTHDMTAPPAAQNCLKVVTCVSGCAGNAACVGACVAKGSASAVTKFNALFACAYSHCLLPDGGTLSADGGAGSCTSNMDTSANCQACVGAQAQGAGCSTELGTCLGDQ